MKFARTVCGDIQAEEMGFTYPHEHLYAVPPTCQKDRDLEVSDYEGSVAELKLFKSVGGQTLVEASTLDYGRNLSHFQKKCLKRQEFMSLQRPDLTNIFTIRLGRSKKYRRNFRYSRRRYFWKGETESEQDS